MERVLAQQENEKVSKTFATRIAARVMAMPENLVDKAERAQYNACGRHSRRVCNCL